MVCLICYLGTLKLGGLVVVNLSKAIFEINALDYCSMNLCYHDFLLQCSWYERCALLQHFMQCMVPLSDSFYCRAGFSYYFFLQAI